MNQIQKIIVSIVVSIVVTYCAYWVVELIGFDDIPSLIIGVVLAGIFNLVFWKSSQSG